MYLCVYMYVHTHTHTFRVETKTEQPNDWIAILRLHSWLKWCNQSFLYLKEAKVNFLEKENTQISITPKIFRTQGKENISLKIFQIYQ